MLDNFLPESRPLVEQVVYTQCSRKDSLATLKGGNDLGSPGGSSWISEEVHLGEARSTSPGRELSREVIMRKRLG